MCCTFNTIEKKELPYIYNVHVHVNTLLTTVSAFDVKEFFHSYVSSKSSFSDHKPFTSDQLEGNLVRKN